MGAQRKKKEAKKKKGRGPWKLPHPWKSEMVAFGDFFPMISTAAWKSHAQNASAFPQLPQAQRRITINQNHYPFAVSHRWGALHRYYRLRITYG
jgi:hypothetical protein